MDLATVPGAHTWTWARSFSRRAGPMPSTSASWSTLVNDPLASRQAMMAAAVTGPDAGQRVELLFGRGVQIDGSPGAVLLPPASGRFEAGDALGSDATELPIVVFSPGGAAMPTMICSPSATRRAMFSPIRSAPSSAPPAALSASAMRAPDDNVTSPGLCTSPTTLTTTGPSGAGADGVRLRRRDHLHRRQFGRYHRWRLVAKQRDHGDQHGHHTDDCPTRWHRRGRDLRGRPPATPASRRCWHRAASATVRHRIAVVVIGGALGIDVRTEPAVEALGGQFGSHVPDGRCEGRLYVRVSTESQRPVEKTGTGDETDTMAPRRCACGDY